MEMKRLYILFVLLAAVLASCIQDVVYELPEGDKYDNLYLIQAVDNPVTLRMKTSMEGTVSHSFSAFYAGINDAPKDLHLTFTVDPSLVEAYNEKTGGNFVLLPEDAYELPVSETVIKAGQNHTALLEIRFHVSPSMELFTDYLLPLRVQVREKDIRVREELQTLYYNVGLTKDFSPSPVNGKIDLADEIFSFNDKCILAHDNAAGKILRYPYDPESHTVGAPTVLVDPSIDPYWGSSYARMILPARNSLHICNIYGYWIGMPVNEDATTVGLVGAGQYTIITAGMGIILSCIPNQHSVGELWIDMATGGIRNYVLTDNGLGLTGALGFNSGFNYWPYKLRFCYHDDVYGVDTNGVLWKHDYNADDYTFSDTRTQVGEGWGGFTHIIPFGDDLLCRKADGSLLDFAFDPQFYWDIKDLN